jgi:hypothetical protein
MNFSTIFRRPLLLAIPALLAFSACSKEDTPTPTPVPDQGRISVYHMAASANVGLKFLFDDAEKASLTYGQSSLNQALNTGSRVLKVNVASSSVAAIAARTVTVEKDKNYSYFAYADTPTTLAGLFLPDDLTFPTASAGKARIRLVHLGQGSTTPLKLATTVAGVTDIANTDAGFATASSFVDIIPGQYNVAVISGSGATGTIIANVGDGSGSGAGTNKNYEAGKIYTVVLRGITGPFVDPALTPKAVLITNN